MASATSPLALSRYEGPEARGTTGRGRTPTSRRPGYGKDGSSTHPSMRLAIVLPAHCPSGGPPAGFPPEGYGLTTASAPAHPSTSWAYGFGPSRGGGFAPPPSSTATAVSPDGSPAMTLSVSPTVSPPPQGVVLGSKGQAQCPRGLGIEGRFPPSAPLSAAPASISASTRLPRRSPPPAATGVRVLVAARLHPG